MHMCSEEDRDAIYLRVKYPSKKKNGFEKQCLFYKLA
jgi:hypothetical protein